MCFSNWACEIYISNQKYTTLRVSDLLKHLQETHNERLPETPMSTAEIEHIKSIISTHTVTDARCTDEDLEFYLN